MEGSKAADPPNATRGEPLARMPAYFRAVALDYDGTIAFGKPPEECVLAALAQVRRAGRAVVLVTGRILSELRADFPEVEKHFDAIVAENGATLLLRGHERALASPVAQTLERELAQGGVPLRRGTVILAVDAQHDHAVLSAVNQLGLDTQLVRNRAATMVLPAGVSKGSGLQEGLAELGISPHSTVGIGDAENDLALLQACEVGVAVGDAVPSLKLRADHVLPAAGSQAIASFLTDELLLGLPHVQPRRRHVMLGSTEAGAAALVPSSRAQVFIDGPTGSGKSYLAGLFAERLLHAGYTLCVLDPEGDHAALGGLRGVLTLGGRDPLPPAEEVGRIVRHGLSSVVLDMSLRDPAIQEAYVRDVLDELTRVRQECGLPHWIFVEEAHAVASASLARARAQGALCLVTYHPDWLPPSVLQSADVLLTVVDRQHARLRIGKNAAELGFEPSTRELPHVRHQRKYAEGRVPFERGFTFRDAAGMIGLHVCSLAELARGLDQVPSTALAHHTAHGDFSRWIREVFCDLELAKLVQREERAYSSRSADVFRHVIAGLIALRYPLTALD